jgi:hypothetical protein
MNNLSGFISGMIVKDGSHLPDIISRLFKDIDANSKMTAAKRFVVSEWIGFEIYFLPLLTAFIKGILAFTLSQ